MRFRQNGERITALYFETNKERAFKAGNDNDSHLVAFSFEVSEGYRPAFLGFDGVKTGDRLLELTGKYVEKPKEKQSGKKVKKNETALEGALVD
jgi:hypothetical protein